MLMWKSYTYLDQRLQAQRLSCVGKNHSNLRRLTSRLSRLVGHGSSVYYIHADALWISAGLLHFVNVSRVVHGETKHSVTGTQRIRTFLVVK